MLTELLSRFDLDPKETQAFLELVRLGPRPISLWAKHTGTKRSSMYVILQRLTNHGLVSTFSHQGIQYAKALPVNELPVLLNDREKEIADTRLLLKKYLPELLQMEKTGGLIPRVRFYEGAKRVGSLYEDVLKEKSIKSYFHPGRVKKYMPDYYYLIPEALRRNNGQAKELLVRCPEAKEYLNKYNSENHQIRLLPKTTEFSSDTIITKERIYLIGYGVEEVVGTEIWDKELAETQAAIFDLAWTASFDKTN